MACSLTEMVSELALGCLLFPGLFTLSKRCLRKLPISGWGESDAVILSTRIVSTVQAIMASSAGLIIIKSCSKHVLEDRHWLTNAYVLFAVPYFIYDIYAMYLCHSYKFKVKGHEIENVTNQLVLKTYLRKEILMIIHHSVMFAVCFPVSVFVRDNRGDFFVGCMFMAEVSTPFVCLGKVLIQYQQQHTLLHKLNGIMMLMSFFICRILLFPYMYWVYGREVGIPLYRVPLELPPHYNLAAFLLLAPQLYWFSLICRGAWRLFLRRRPLPKGQTPPQTRPQHLNGFLAPSPSPPLTSPSSPSAKDPDRDEQPSSQ